MTVLQQVQKKCKDCCLFYGTDGCYAETVCRYFRDQIERCKWFEKAVLPTDPDLEAKYKEAVGQ